jgi:hypothetical protein
VKSSEAGGAPFHTIEIPAVEFPGAASLRFLKGCGFRRSKSAQPGELHPKIHFVRVARPVSHIRKLLGKLLEHHERHGAVEVRYFGAVAPGVAGLQRPDPEQEDPRTGHRQEHLHLRVRPDQPVAGI